VINGKPNMVETYTLEKYEIIGANNNPNSRSELQGQPILQGWYGPMYDGTTDKSNIPVVRYETKAAYNIYST